MRLALPKGRLWESVMELFEKSEIKVDSKHRNYKPTSNLDNVELFVVKPRNIPKLVESGLVDAGIVGIDLVKDENAEVELILDLKTMPVYLIVAGKQKPNSNKIRVASEYTEITKKYFKEKGIDFEILKTYGSTECFVPEFADLIVDHTQTGETLQKNNLEIFDLIMKSTTHLISNKNVTNKTKKLIENLKIKLEKGITQMDFKYPNFISEEKIRGMIK